MFVAIVRFPAVPPDGVETFLDWFAWSNDVLAGTPGLRGRRLLRAVDGSYTALVEHDSAETFRQMHHTEAAARVQAELGTILDGRPEADTFEVAAELTELGSCCSDVDRDSRRDHGDRSTCCQPASSRVG